jgi:hypothetical protein
VGLVAVSVMIGPVWRLISPLRKPYRIILDLNAFSARPHP